MKSSTILNGLSPALSKLCTRKTMPTRIAPMLATLTDHYFSDNHWLYEHKFDGQRCIAFKKGSSVRLLSRNDLLINHAYPEIVAALQAIKAPNFIIDGEIIARKKGVSDFELLQERINLRRQEAVSSMERAVPIQYAIFDLVYLGAYDVRHLPLYARKQLLKNLPIYNNLLLYTDHVVGDGLKLFKKACHLGWEGVIAKRIDGIYVGKRSRDWLKFKCIMKQELVIGGYTNPQGSRAHFGALLVGYFKDGTLRYAGKVGTGFSQETLTLLGSKMKKLKTAQCPFVDYDASPRNIHWIKPVLVAEFQFAQWTKAGRLRVGRYKGLRKDKKARDVIKEVPANI